MESAFFVFGGIRSITLGVLTVGVSSRFEGRFGGHFDFFFHHETETKTILNFDHLSQDRFALRFAY